MGDGLAANIDDDQGPVRGMADKGDNGVDRRVESDDGAGFFLCRPVSLLVGQVEFDMVTAADGAHGEQRY
jgi:hypothetical protein